MSVINQNLLLTPEGYQISRSVRLRSSASAYFNRTPSVTTSTTKFTWSGWVKRGQLGINGYLLLADNGTYYNFLKFNTSDQLETGFSLAGGSYGVKTSAVFRDPSSWYHIIYSVDTTQATSTNREQLYVNGVLQVIGSTQTSGYVPQNTASYCNTSGVAMQIGSFTRVSNYFDGYLTEVNFIDGQALTPSSFGETDAITGVWKPKKYAGTYGTNGFYLNFSDPSAATAAAIGKDYSGNGNNWTPNNISVTAGVTYDSMLDVPTMWADGGNGRGNYCTLNPLVNGGANTYSNGNLSALGAGSAQVEVGTIAVNSGKWYWESFLNSAPSSQPFAAGVQLASVTNNVYPGTVANSVGYYYDGNKYLNGTGAAAYGNAYTQNDIIGTAFDADAGTVTFYKNGVSQGVAATGFTGNYFVPAFSGYNTAIAVNFGQRPFSYTPPTGFKALNTQNLPDSTIKKGNQYFDVSLYTGTNASLAVTNGGFTPNLVWMKRRSTAASSNLIDSVRGLKKGLVSDLTNAEGTATAGSGLLSLDANGFTIGTEYDGGSGSTNASGSTYAAWQWKKGATQGFDIVTYTGTGVATTVAHSLGVAPKLIIAKSRSSGTAGWPVYHASIGAANYLALNTTAASAAGAVWNSTTPTSSVFSVGATGNGINDSGATYVAYLFAEVAGFSKFGSYTGNGSADGPFVYCGFRPRFVLVKDYSNAGVNWTIFDTARDSYNVEQQQLFPNLSNAEAAGGASVNSIDVTANGFKIRGNGGGINTNADGYIFAAFAENPFKNSLAR